MSKVDLFTSKCCGRCINCNENECLKDKYYFCRKHNIAVQEHYYCKEFIDFITKSNSRYEIFDMEKFSWIELKKTYDWASKVEKEKTK